MNSSKNVKFRKPSEFTKSLYDHNSLVVGARNIITLTFYSVLWKLYELDACLLGKKVTENLNSI